MQREEQSENLCELSGNDRGAWPRPALALSSGDGA